VWQDLWPWLLGALLVAMAAGALWLALRRPRADHVHDLRLRAFDAWIAGDLVAARRTLREYVHHHPHDHESYFQLATLLRLTGEPGKAAALYQGLAVREDLPPWRRVAAALGLAESFIELGRYDDADATLREVADLASQDERWYSHRFAVAVRRGDDEAANQALRSGVKRVAPGPAAHLAELHAAWITDRAMELVRAGELDRAGSLLGKAKGLRAAEGRVLLVRAMHAAAAGDPEATVKAVTDGLLAHPERMAPAMKLLKGALLDTGRFARLVPILETACRDENAPAALWAALARIYEKLGRRDDALRLIGSKRGDPRLTPDALAPFLRLLTAEVPDAAFSRVWNMLSDPTQDHGYRCTACGRREPHLRWFCDGCLAPDSFVAAESPAAVPAGAAQPVLETPPRF
jgi:lipopolysaccharide biosynthesis regulator YciM